MSGSALGDPWAVEAVDVAANLLEMALGSYVGEGKGPDGGFLLAGDQRELAAVPDAWSDGSLVVDKVLRGRSGWMWSLRTLLVLLGFTGSGVIWIYSLLCLMVGVRPAGSVALCRDLCRLCSVLRFGVFWLPCKVVRMHVGVDNLIVVNHVSGIIAGGKFVWPFPLVKDGDLLLRVQQMVRWRAPGNACVTNVKGHADEGLVAEGRVRDVDRIGNNEADAAADLGRKRIHFFISDARRLVNGACAR